MLLLSGFAVLGACIIVPARLDCQQLAAQQLALAEQLKQLRINNHYYQEAIEAAQHNAAFNERLLIEKLNYHRPGEQALLIATEPQSTAAVSSGNYLSPENPSWLQAFAEQDIRNILLVMSTGLVLFAFVYYRPTKRLTPVPDIPVRPASAKFISQQSATGNQLLQQVKPHCIDKVNSQHSQAGPAP